MKQFIRDYLTFNKRERNGIVILLLIITLLLIYLNISDKFVKSEQVDFSKFEKAIAAFSAAQQESDSVSAENNFTDNNNDSVINNSNLKIEYFTFNPNGLPPEDWKRLGLNDKQIHTIKNYEAKGGQFRTKEDVKKMYCISQEQYLRLDPYINIPNQLRSPDSQLQTASSPRKSGVLRTQLPTIELNSADSAYLTKIKGIGGFYAKSIIKYREQLGGFAFKEQLMEIWKFDNEKFDAIKDYVIVDETEIKKININTCTAVQLKHPYISWNAANAIVNYRSKHGKYKKLEEIKKTGLVDEETFRKLVYYLILE